MGARLTCEAVIRAEMGEPAKRQGAELFWHCKYPDRHNHGDSKPSLGVSPKKDRWKCWSENIGGKGGWSLAAFLAGVSPDDKPAVTAWLRERGLINGKRAPKAASARRGPRVAEYVYRDAGGNLVARKRRFEPGGNGRKKDFAWERWENGKWVAGLGAVKTPLYRWPEIVGEPWTLLVEGEKDADAGAMLGLPTTTSGSAGSWREDHAEALRGKDVVIIADGDDAGRKHAHQEAASLWGKAQSVKVLEVPGSKDLAEAIEKGAFRESLLALFEETPEWKPATGAEILGSVTGFVRRFVSLSDSQALVVALWVAHTHAFDAAECTPYLAVSSAEKQSAKTRLLEVLKGLVERPWLTGRVSAAVLTRKIDAERPSLLLDESDAAFSGEKEYAEALRAVLNSGYRRGGAASCCVGQGANIGYKDFSIFCPKAIAGIGRLPDTVADRSVPIRLKRARRGKVQRFRLREGEREAAPVAAKLAAWSAANLERLRDARPEIPPRLSDRQADVWEPLLAIADLAGGDWPQAARNAAVALCAQAQAEDDSIGGKLLSDIKRIFYACDDDGGELLPGHERVASCDLAKALSEMEDRPWAEWGKSQKPITQPQLARLLGRYDIGPKAVRLSDGRRLKGYEREQFAEAWELYLPTDWALAPCTPDARRDGVTTRENTGGNGNFQPVTPAACHASENAVSANKHAPCHGVTARKPGCEGEGQRSQMEVEWEA